MIAGKSLDPRQAEDGLNPSLGPGVLDPDGLPNGLSRLERCEQE